MSRFRFAAGVIVGALALVSAPMEQTVRAEPVSARPTTGASQRSTATDFSARRYVRRGYRSYGGAAAMGLAIGTVGAIIANEQRRSYRRQYVQPYYGQPYYSQPYYGQPYYGQYGGGYVSSPYDQYGRYRQCGNGYYGYGCGD